MKYVRATRGQSERNTNHASGSVKTNSFGATRTTGPNFSASDKRSVVQLPQATLNALGRIEAR